MVVIKIAESKTRCPFSKTFIKSQNRICLFSIDQFNAFKKIINEELNHLFPEDIINIIIEKTGYQKLIGRFGHENLTYWSKVKNIYIINQLKIMKLVMKVVMKVVMKLINLHICCSIT